MPYNTLISRTDTAALVPEQVANDMLTSLSVESATLGLATRIPVARSQIRFPVLSALPTAYFVNGDTGLKQTTKAAWANRYLNVEEIATIIPVPEAVMDDSSFDVWASLRPLMENAIARTLDAAVFFGTNKPASWPAGIAPQALAAGNVVVRGTNDAAAGGLHGDLSDLVGKLEADGYVPNGAVGNVTVKSRLRNVRATTGETMVLPVDLPQVMYPGSLAGLWPVGLNAAELIAGDYSKMVVGVRQDMTYKVLTEGVITDAAGVIQYNLPQQDMIALRLVFRAGWEVSNPINYLQGDPAVRFPFALLNSPAV